MSVESIDANAPSHPSLRDVLAYFIAAAVVFVVLLPTLPWQQFGGDSEDLVVQPVLELRHGAQSWWIPTLGGQPRIRKPPLPTWISAAAVRPKTVAKLSSRDPAEREAGYRSLALEVRWPALLASCLMLVAVGLTGQLLAGRTVGIMAAFFCGSNYLFLQAAREATTDPYLALFVALANLFLVLAIFERRYWTGFLLAGISLGLAFMAKGPVCLLQSVVPILLYLAYRRWIEKTPAADPQRNWLLPLLVGLCLMMFIALSWYIVVLITVKGSLSTFTTELAGEGVKNISHDPLYFYLILVPCMAPWMGFFLLGWRHLFGRRMALAAFLVLAPMLVMTVLAVRDKKVRYIVPTLGPASILAAYGATTMAKPKQQRTGYEAVMMDFQWGTLIVIAVAAPIAGVFLKTLDGASWNSWAVAIPAAIVGFGLAVLGVRLERRGALPAAVVGGITMILPALLALHGLLASRENLSELKPVADRLKEYLFVHGGQAAYFELPDKEGKPVTLDLDIYLDQPVPILHDVSELTGPDRPAAVVTIIREDELYGPATGLGIPQKPEFRGWSPLFDMQGLKHPFHIWVLVPVMPAVAPVPAASPVTSAPVNGRG